VEDALRALAFHDTLTQLPNRRLLLDRMTQDLLLGKRENRHLAVLFIDLNKFKLVNDAYGHDAGDQMLIEVANRLQKIVRQSDTVARLGGDEFVVLLAGLSTDQEQAAQHTAMTAEKIRSALGEEYLLKNVQLPGSASVGIRLILGGDMDPEQILKEADSAMYEIKKSAAQP
jgi:diguanylate cyclase (GGDEF)-like protein